MAASPTSFGAVNVLYGDDRVVGRHDDGDIFPAGEVDTIPLQGGLYGSGAQEIGFGACTGVVRLTKLKQRGHSFTAYAPLLATLGGMLGHPEACLHIHRNHRRSPSLVLASSLALLDSKREACQSSESSKTQRNRAFGHHPRVSHNSNVIDSEQALIERERLPTLGASGVHIHDRFDPHELGWSV
jgi:hypothetical protein